MLIYYVTRTTIYFSFNCSWKLTNKFNFTLSETYYYIDKKRKEILQYIRNFYGHNMDKVYVQDLDVYIDM